MLTVGSLFTGIGGLDLGLERAGMRVIWQSEIDPYACAVLRKHWPHVPNLGDIKAVIEVPSVDVLCGGFPCQPVSLAGKRRGSNDTRWLWPEFARLIRLLRPQYALMENVPGLLTDGIAEVLGDLAECGYDAEWASIPAAALGAPHLRYRVFILAYPNGGRLQERPELDSEPLPNSAYRGSYGQHPDGLRSHVADASVHGRLTWGPGDPREEQERREPDRGRVGRPVAHADILPAIWTTDPREEPHPWHAEPNMGRVANGIPSRVDRLRALGNAVVPQVAEWVGRQIVTHHKEG